MNRFYDVQQSLQHENYALLTQQFQRVQSQNATPFSQNTTHYGQNTTSYGQNTSPYAPPSPTYEAPPLVSTHSGEPRPLPDMMAPGRFDVICARGSAAANHVGNLRFREIIRQKLSHYNTAKTKLEKSLLVTSIVDAVRDYTPDGGFIKQDNNGQWYDVGDALAREKIGQCIRDQLHSKYKSSTKAKKQRRKELEKKKKVTGRTTPPKEVEARFDPAAVVTPRADDEARYNPQPGQALAFRVMQFQKEDALSLMMLAPIGESFLAGAETLLHSV